MKKRLSKVFPVYLCGLVSYAFIDIYQKYDGDAVDKRFMNGWGPALTSVGGASYVI
jgi:hypothetical protein